MYLETGLDQCRHVYTRLQTDCKTCPDCAAQFPKPRSRASCQVLAGHRADKLARNRRREQGSTNRL